MECTAAFNAGVLVRFGRMASPTRNGSIAQLRGEGELEQVDVLIVGAGLSGIGAACHLKRRCPRKSIAILEARECIGGTWDLFRYPGIRSDSDMYTLGYSFRPWREAKSIADGPSILRYVRETATEYGVDELIRFRHRALRAEWDGETARWTVHAKREDTGEETRIRAGFVLVCSGYYRYDEGYSPEFPGSERFAGRIVHPQKWTPDIDYAGKRVIVIGSGATAVTLVPAMAQTAAHVTMLQRSPSYVIALPGEDPIARALKRVLPLKAVYPLIRWKNVLLTLLSFQLSRRRPEVAKAIVRKGLERNLPADYDIDTHFKPAYNPWEQRLCLVPDGDLFEALTLGRASIATGNIDTFTEKGILLTSGEELEADLVVTATGLNLIPMGGMQLIVDGSEIDVSQTLGYKGMMLSGVPNMAMTFGYTNASWTLKCDLTCAYVCRLLNHMDARGLDVCVAENDDPTLQPEPFIDFSSGYVQRAISKFPKQGSRAPWRLYQNYALDIMSLRRAPLEDEAMRFSRAAVGHAARTPQPA
jgi:cation diffusion facilitator CzcD-associated flavoprotein CzcO